MPRNKMEKDFSQKLNERELTPTPAAWDRLDAMLTVAENQKPKRSRNWMFLAAGFAGILLLASMFFKSQTSSVANENLLNEIAPVATSAPVEKSSESESGIFQDQSKTNREVKTNPISQNQSVVAQIATIKDQETANPVLNPNREAVSIINPNPNPNQSQSQSQNQSISVPSPNAVADEELLASVQSKRESKKPASGVKVSARNLLFEVDPEKNESTSSKFIRQLGKNYQHVKVAVANRNFEENQ